MALVMGIDPGKNGAFAIIKDGALQKVVPFNGDIKICRTVFRYLDIELYCIERVTSSPKQGVVSAFTFGRFFEAVVTAASLAAESSCILVRPQEWQSALGVLSGGNKTVLFTMAKRMFPKGYAAKMFNRKSADAVLLAHYAHKYAEYLTKPFNGIV